MEAKLNCAIHRKLRVWRRLGGQSFPGCSLLSCFSSHNFVLENKKLPLAKVWGLEDLSLLPILPLLGQSKSKSLTQSQLSLWVPWISTTITAHIYQAVVCARVLGLHGAPCLVGKLGIPYMSSELFALVIRSKEMDIKNRQLFLYWSVFLGNTIFFFFCS